MPVETGRRSRLAGGFLLASFVLFVILVLVFDKHAPLAKDIASGLDSFGMPRPPSWEYPFGTDALGRCLAVRLASGALLSLLTALLATAIAVFVGGAVGLMAGYAGGRVDSWLMRVVDVVLSFPLLLLGVGIAAALRGRASGVFPSLFVLGFVGWPSVARVVRGRARELREETYVEAARALGSPHSRIMLRHILPAMFGPLFVLTALSFPQMLLAESTLSFLGLGAPAPMPAWGRMLAEGQAHLRSAPWMVAAPGIAILVVSLAFGLLGEGFRRRLDSGARQRE